MDIRVWKYELANFIGNRVTLHMPKGARVLDVQMRNYEPCIWCLVDSDEAKVDRVFIVVRTGQSIAPHAIYPHEYVGTFLSADGAVTWHVFEGRHEHRPSHNRVTISNGR